MNISRPLLLAPLALSACAPVPPLLDDLADAAPTHDAAPSNDALPVLETIPPADAAVVAPVLEYRLGECVLTFDSSRFTSPTTTFRLSGTVHCDAADNGDPLMLGVLDPLSISASISGVPCG